MASLHPTKRRPSLRAQPIKFILFLQVHSSRSFLPFILFPSDTLTWFRMHQQDPTHEEASYNFERIQDNYGYRALQAKLTNNSPSSIVRIQDQRDQSLEHIHSPRDVMSEIHRVKKIQQKYCPERIVEPYPRYWEPTKIDKSNSSFPLSILQFNILAEGLSAGPSTTPCFSDCNVTATLDEPHDTDTDTALKNCFGGFSQIPCPEVILDFSLRRWRLIEILLGLDVLRNQIDQEDYGVYDILAVEEMDRFHGFFQPILSIVGYKGIFAPKTHAPGVNLGYYSDGCALFWKEKQFEYCACQRGAYIVGSQVYVIATLRHVQSHRIIVVAVTHLKAKEGVANEAMRYTQTMQLRKAVLAAADEAKQKYSTVEDKDHIPIFIMGDFNSHPKEHNNDNDEHQSRTRSCIEALTKKDSCFGRSTNTSEWFSSVYPISPVPAEFFTTWKTRGPKTTRRVIDYIFHNSLQVKGLQLIQFLSVPMEKDMEPGRLPGFRYPSDHVALAAKFLLERLLS